MTLDAKTIGTIMTAAALAYQSLHGQATVRQDVSAGCVEMVQGQNARIDALEMQVVQLEGKR